MNRLLTLSAAAVATTLLSVGGVAGATALTRDSVKPIAVIKTISAPVPAAPTAEPTPAPAPAPEMVAVQAGDNLTKIASEHDTTYLRLFYANEKIANPDLIFPGDELRVPTAEETLTARELPTTAPVEVKQKIAINPAADTQPRAAVGDGSVWDRLAACEAGGNWAINTGNGFYGGLQFTLSSWASVGGSGYPNQASREEQISRGQALQARQGWGAWPACSAKLGLY